MDEPMRVSVDPKACAGSAFCQQISPDLFRVDETGVAQVLLPEVPPHLANLAHEAEDTCPTNAIAVTE